MAVATGILFTRAGVGANAYDPLPQFRSIGESRVALATASGIPNSDVALGSVSESGAKVAAALIDYNLLIHTGHGSQQKCLGDYSSAYQPIVDLTDVDSLDLIDGRAIYSFACQTGADLMPSIVSGVAGRQALASAGYDDNYGFMIGSGTEDDIYFVSSMAPGFKFIESLIEDKEWSVCYDDTLAECDVQIAYWTTGAGATDYIASIMIEIANAAKDRLVKFGDDTWKLSGDTSPSIGTINVATNTADAGFTITGPATYTGTGTTYTNATATPGTYTIVYDAIAGYATPVSESKVLIPGSSITFTGVYVAASSTGTINVNCNVSNTFTLTGPATYSGTGTTYSNTSALPGLYTISFGTVAGYTKPANQTRNLNIGGSITFTGTYVADTVIPDPVDPGTPESEIQVGDRITTIERTVQEV